MVSFPFSCKMKIQLAAETGLEALWSCVGSFARGTRAACNASTWMPPWVTWLDYPTRLVLGTCMHAYIENASRPLEVDRLRGGWLMGPAAVYIVISYVIFYRYTFCGNIWKFELKCCSSHVQAANAMWQCFGIYWGQLDCNALIDKLSRQPLWCSKSRFL